MEPSCSKDVAECETCGKRFCNRFDLIAHEKRLCKTKKCKNCGAIFPIHRDLLRHERNRKDIGCTHCDRKFCSSEHLNKHLRTIQDMVDTDIDLDQPIQPETGYEEDDGYKAILKNKATEIDDREEVRTNDKMFNRKIDAGFTYQELKKIIIDIYTKQANAFKINIGFSFILYNTIENIFKYHYNSSNNLLFEHAFTVTEREDIDELMKKIISLDLATNYYLKRPNSSWKLAGITNVEIFIYEMKDVPIGRPPLELPSYIMNSKSIYALVCDYSHKRNFKDDNCFFRCLALYQGAPLHGLERHATRLLKEAATRFGNRLKNGVNISHIPALEVCFNVAVNIYSLNEDGNADITYLSRMQHKPMHLNLYKNHFSYICKFDMYAKRFECNMCNRIFDQSCNLQRHVETCCIEQKEIYIGGKFRRDETIFERLEKAGFHVPEQDRFYPFISAFDLEALQVPRNEMSRGRNIHYEHVPATFSVCSNIPGHTEAVHISSKGDPQQLIDEMVSIQLNHQEKASKILREKYSKTIKSLEKTLETLEDSDKEYKRIKTLYSSFTKYCDQLVILGFNSQKYDIPLIRRYLPSSLYRLDSNPSFVIKKQRSYIAIATKRLKYLDLCNYLAAGTSLEGFYKSYNVDTAKGSLPYQWLDSYDKFDHPSLPAQEEFKSILTNTTISEEKYRSCVQVWKDHGMSKFSEYLEYYNNHDVIGMVQGVEKMLKIENRNGLDIFKDSVSLPGLTQKYLFRKLHQNDYFVGIGKEHAHIYKELREYGVVGGPSIIYHRYHEADVTKIKGKDLCKRIIGFDANSLYLSCTAKDMPTGKYILREKRNNFKKQTPYSKQSIQWLNHLIKEGVNIQHAENSPHQEKQIGIFSVDGYCEETKTVYEFYGCYHHGHNCGNNYDPVKWKATLDRGKEIRALGCKIQTITSCEWTKNPASKIWYQTENVECTFRNIEEAVVSGESFGIIKCSLKVPDHLIDHFSEFPPIFKNCEITLADIGDHMQEYCRSITRKNGVNRSLISSMYGDNLVILTPLFRKYIEMGLICTDIDWIMEYNPKPVFKWFQDEVVHDRRMADLDPKYKIRGETSKTKGNCAYGRTIMDKTRHTSVCFTTEKKIGNHVKNPLFKCFDELNDNIYEVEKEKRKIVLDTPIQIGIAVYSYAKLSLLCFWEFINKYLDNDLYQLMECDTDSLYIAFSRDSIDDCVKPELREEWNQRKWDFFSSEDDTPIEFGEYTVPFRQWDKRSPGKYKAEFVGVGMICLNSKVYHIWGYDKNGKLLIKTSCKGTQKKRNELVKEDFLRMINERKPIQVENAGFIQEGHKIKTYVQRKKGLEYFYAKRKVLTDGVSTTHLDI